MKIFLDTSTNKIIFGLIDDNKKVVAFQKNDSNKDMVKITIPLLETFLKTNNLKIEDLDGIYFTIGPGSFTGIKIAYLIAKTFSVTNHNFSFNTIGTLELAKRNNIFPVVQISNKNFYFYKKKWFFSNEQIVFAKEAPKKKNVEFNFQNFDALDLEKKLPKFQSQQMNDIELIYIN